MFVPYETALSRALSLSHVRSETARAVWLYRTFPEHPSTLGNITAQTLPLLSRTEYCPGPGSYSSPGQCSTRSGILVNMSFPRGGFPKRRNHSAPC